MPMRLGQWPGTTRICHLPSAIPGCGSRTPSASNGVRRNRAHAISTVSAGLSLRNLHANGLLIPRQMPPSASKTLEATRLETAELPLDYPASHKPARRPPLSEELAAYREFGEATRIQIGRASCRERV